MFRSFILLIAVLGVAACQTGDGAAERSAAPASAGSDRY